MFIGFYGVDDYSFDRSAWHVDGCLCCFWVSVGSPSAGFRSGVIMPGPMRPLSAIIGGVGEVLEGTGESEGFCVVGRARGRAQVARPGFRSDRRRLEGLRPVGWCLGGGRAGPAGSGRSRGCRRTNHKGWGRVEVLHGGGEVLENLALGEVSTGRWFGRFGGSACAEGLGELARWMIVARVSCWVVSVWGLPVLYQERGCVSIRIVYKTAVVAAMKTCCRTHARACLEIIGCAYPNHLCGRTLPALPTPRQRHGQLMETKSFA